MEKQIVRVTSAALTEVVNSGVDTRELDRILDRLGIEVVIDDGEPAHEAWPSFDR